MSCFDLLRPPASRLRPMTLCVILLAANTCTARREERFETFDRDPGWHGFNNRSTTPEPRSIRQDFGFNPTQNAQGKAAGELGGTITPAAEPAYYAKRIDKATFDDRLTASGTLACTGSHFHALLGFFNSGTINEWRTPNSIAIRLYGRGDVFYAYVEYATSQWRAGGDNPGGFATVVDPETGRNQLAGFTSRGDRHSWALDYDPTANDGQGSVAVTIDDQTAVCRLDPGHKQDGATFDRFGLLNIIKSHDTGGELWLDDITINGELETFDSDPDWDALGNRVEHVTNNVRPRFDFGFSPTNFAGGWANGELGGLVFRGDCRDSSKLAFYGDRLEPLTLDRPLRAAGKVALRRGVSDSTTLIGFFHSRESAAVSESQSSGAPKSFLGVAIEGPSSQGFLFYPVCRMNDDAAHGQYADPPRILPDGESHDWTLEYLPGESGPGKIAATLDGGRVVIDLLPPAGSDEIRFDRFGIVTTWIDGNAQNVYFDDLKYTWRQKATKALSRSTQRSRFHEFGLSRRIESMR